MINSRNLRDLEPRVEAKARLFEAECRREGIDIIFTSTRRDFASQDALYAQGRTKPGKIITNAAGGFSFHNYGVAFDFVPIVDGKAVWNDDALWERCGAIGVRCGLEWGGSWPKFKDRPHMQDTGGMSIHDLQERAGA